MSQERQELMNSMYTQFCEKVKESTAKSRRFGTRECAAFVTGARERLSLDTTSIHSLLQIESDSGWPPFRMLQDVLDPKRKSQFINKGWQGFSDAQTPNMHYVDMYRVSEDASFYYVEALHDDIFLKGVPMEVIDKDMEVRRIFDCVSLLLKYSQLFQSNVGGDSTVVSFRWRGLKDRELFSRKISRPMNGRFQCHQEDYETTLIVPVNVERNAIKTCTWEIAKGFFQTFSSYKLSEQEVRNIVDRQEP